MKNSNESIQAGHGQKTVSGLSRLSRRDVSQTDKVTGEPVPLSPKWRGAQVIEGLGIWPPECGDPVCDAPPNIITGVDDYVGVSLAPFG